MGKHSSLGPIDPQIGGVPAHGIIEEVKHAVTEVTKAPYLAPLYQMIFAKYGPTLLGEAQKSIDWANEMVTKWLETGMFVDDASTAKDKAAKVLDGLGDHALTLSHARHISVQMARDLSLRVLALEDDPLLQDAVLSVHHACIQTFSATPALKIIENQNGIAYIETRAQALLVHA